MMVLETLMPKECQNSKVDTRQVPFYVTQQIIMYKKTGN